MHSMDLLMKFHLSGSCEQLYFMKGIEAFLLLSDLLGIQKCHFCTC